MLMSAQFGIREIHTLLCPLCFLLFPPLPLLFSLKYHVDVEEFMSLIL